MRSTIPQVLMINIIVFLIFLSIPASASWIGNNDLNKNSNTQILEKVEKITLQDTIVKKLISAKFRGTGAAFGDAITVEVKNKTKFPLIIEVIPGTKLISDDTSKQNMVLGKVKGKLVDEKNYMVDDFIEIQPKSTGKYILEAYCIESHKPVPTPTTSLKIAEFDSKYFIYNSKRQ